MNLANIKFPDLLFELTYKRRQICPMQWVIIPLKVISNILKHVID